MQNEFKASLQQALEDFPYAGFQVFPNPYEELPEAVIAAIECTFNPRQLIIDFLGKSVLQGRKKLWGWGIIEAEKDICDDVEIRGMFDVANKDDWTKGRLSPQEKMFWGHYDPSTRHWSFHFGR